jgi:hypothetical protein
MLIIRITVLLSDRMIGTNLFPEFKWMKRQASSLRYCGVRSRCVPVFGIDVHGGGGGGE